MKFPNTRMRRLRQKSWVRDIVAENMLSASDLILPLFINNQESSKQPIKTLPDIYRLGKKELFETIEKAIELGIKAVSLFPVFGDDIKDEAGSHALDEGNFLFSRIRDIKNKFPEMGVIADVALDPYTSHGHDGILNSERNDVDNDKTIEILNKYSLMLAESGVDMLAPSDMMDGRVGAIRGELEKAGFKDVMILSYAVKYASKLYGPFRDAVSSSSALGSADKKTYQMNPANIKEAMREVELDINEGADIIMVKPANYYQDVIYALNNRFDVPLFAYQVSGEYSMMKFASKNNVFNFMDILMESLISLKRSGAKAIITYGAIEIAEKLKKDAQ